MFNSLYVLVYSIYIFEIFSIFKIIVIPPTLTDFTLLFKKITIPSICKVVKIQLYFKC